MSNNSTQATSTQATTPAPATPAPATPAPATPATVANVTVAGKGARYAEGVATAVIAATSTEYDWTARGAIPAAILAACGVTRETAPAQKVGPKGEQRSTDWGRGIDAVAKQVKAQLSSDAAPKPATLRASLSGEGGCTVVIDMTSELGRAILAYMEASHEA